MAKKQKIEIMPPGSMDHDPVFKAKAIVGLHKSGRWKEGVLIYRVQSLDLARWNIEAKSGRLIAELGEYLGAIEEEIDRLGAADGDWVEIEALKIEYNETKELLQAVGEIQANSGAKKRI